MIRFVMLFLALMLLLQGCVYFNDEGIGKRKYRDCVEYYDAQGLYHKECDPNLIDYDEIPDKLKKTVLPH